MKEFESKKKIIFILIFFILFFFLIEISLRILKIEYPIFQKHDPIRGFSLLPNAKGNWNREGYGKIHINSDGLRDIDHKLIKNENTLRIAILGDSMAEARSVNLVDTFWYKLNNDLKNCKNFHNGKKIEVINFGVSEYGTTQQYLTLKHKVWKYDPDLIILAFYSGNDVADNLKSLSGKQYRPYFLFKDDVLFDLDDSFKSSKPYKILSSTSGQLFIQISQYSRIAQLLREAYVQIYFSNNSKNNLKKTNENNKKESNVYNPSDAIWSKAWITTEKILKLINQEIKNKDKEFILVSLSTPKQVHPNKISKIDDLFYPEKRLQNFSNKNSIKFISLAREMRDIAIKKNVFFHGFENTKLGTGHWNKLGHEKGSKLISEGICNFY